MSTKQKSNKNRVLLTVVAILLLATIFCYFGYKKLHKNKPTPNAATSPTATQEKINMEPATAEEKKEANDHKASLPSNGQPSSNTSNSIKTVTPIITFTEQDKQSKAVEVGSFVPGIVENGGTCEASFSMGNNSFKKQNVAVEDATTTRCPVFSVARTEFPNAGTWTVSVVYNSNKAQGSSEAKQIQVE